MKPQLFTGLLVVTAVFCICESSYAGTGKGGGKISVDVCNTNQFDDENGDIRVWLLTEDEASSPPTTKAEADALGGMNTPGASMGGFSNLDAGNYVLVAANEGHYQSLEDGDSFAQETDYSTVAFTIEEGTMTWSVQNGEGENRVPVISEGCDGNADDDSDDS